MAQHLACAALLSKHRSATASPASNTQARHGGIALEYVSTQKVF